jgi:hypothetical protein
MRIPGLDVEIPRLAFSLFTTEVRPINHHGIEAWMFKCCVIEP